MYCLHICLLFSQFLNLWGVTLIILNIKTRSITPIKFLGFQKRKTCACIKLVPLCTDGILL